MWFVSFLNGLTVANSMNDKNEPPTKVSSNVVTKRCIIQVEPLVLNDVVITPSQTKRRASRSIPEESNVTPKRSKLNSQDNKKTKESVLSPRQRFGKCKGSDDNNKIIITKIVIIIIIMMIKTTITIV